MIIVILAPPPPPPEWRGQRSIVKLEEFQENWNLFTQGMFKDMDWNNVVIAGGSVLGCLLPGNHRNQN